MQERLTSSLHVARRGGGLGDLCYSKVMRTSGAYLLMTLAFLPALHCGGEGGTTDTAGSSGSTASGGSSGTGASGGTSGTTVPEDYVGRWSVSGTDARGAYVGEVEVRPGSDGLRFLRSIRYTGTKVEDGRELHVAWTGTARRTGPLALALDVSLDPRGFIAKRGTLTRSLTDGVIAVTATVRTDQGAVRARYTASGASWEEGWERPLPLPVDALLSAQRTNRPAHDPPTAIFATAAQSQFGSYRALPEVAPYASRPEFKAAIHFIVDDPTDYDFYRKNSDAIRVWNKPIDGISIQEAKLRADAFRWSLADKAARFGADLESKFVDATGMVTEGGPESGPVLPSNDGALWTATYLAAEAYRYQVTGDPAALSHARRSLDAILKLQEVTGDWTQFARTLRLAGGPADPRWHPGAGALAGIEWRSTGNNDMLNGVLYGQIVGYGLFCKSGNDPICARIRTNAKHIADDISTSIGSSDLYGAWIAAVVSDNVIERAKYRAKAESAWATQKLGIRAAPSMYEQGLADWSGLHLNFVSDTIALLLAREVDLGGDAQSVYRDVVRKSYANVKGLRLPMWELMSQSFGEPKNASATSEAKWILRELPFPKPMANINHSVRPDFCVSPYPRNAWKNDWTTSDRVRSLHSFPYYEVPADDYYWKEHMEFDGDTEHWVLPGADYVHLYWFARKEGIFTGAE